MLNDRMYDITKRGDCKEISIAMIVAYRDSVDTKIIDKLKHLQYVQDLKFNTKFLEDLAYILKQGL